MKPSDKLTESVIKFQEGDKSAFEEVYRLSYAYLHTCIIHIVKDSDITQDMLQETYLEICRNIGQLQKAQNFLGWASVIASRKCFAVIKKRNTEGSVHENTMNSSEQEEFIPESFMENQDRQRMIMEIIDGLTDMQRLCIIGFYYNELSLEEISDALEIPINTVKSHLNRAKTKIKEAVVELDEKKGIKLYSLAPLMLLLLGAEAEACAVPEMPEELTKELSGGSINNNGTTAAGKAAGKLAAGKIYGIVAVVGVVVIVGVVGIMISHRSSGEPVQPQPEETTPVQTDVEMQETEEAQEVVQVEPEVEEQQEEPEAEERTLKELFVLDDSYENYGNAYGGSMPIKKDGLWGAVNYDNELIVPCEYEGFSAAGDKAGNFVLYNSSGDYGREYFLFDNRGSLLYQGEDRVRASGGMYITLSETDNDEVNLLEFHSLDGTVLVSEEIAVMDARINGFYDGICNFYSGYGSDIYVDTGSSQGPGPYEGDVIPRIAAVDSQGSLSWREDPYYYIWWDRINSSIARSKGSEAAGGQSNVNGNGAGGSFFMGRTLLSTMNHGCYITGNDYMEAGYISAYSVEGNNIANINYFLLAADANGAITYSMNHYNEESYYRGYYVDGVTFYNYGPNMVFVVDGKNILVDFSKNSNPGNESENLNISEVVTAVYDYISMADEEYWLVQSGDRWGYIDHDGNEMAMYEDAGTFVNGYALVLEDGEAWLIDTEFNRLENLGAADSVAAIGELYTVTINDEMHIYQY